MVKENIFQRGLRKLSSFNSGAVSTNLASSGTDPMAQLVNASGERRDTPPLWQNFFVHKVAIGSTGTETYAGYPREEYLHDLLGKDRAKIFDKMRRSDTQITMLLRAITNPIKSANWEIEPASDDPADIAVADKIRHILFDDMSKLGGFARFVDEALTAPIFGHAVFEKTYKLVLNHPKFGTYHGIKGLDLISAKTIYQWNLDPDGHLQSVTQIAIGDLHRYVQIPAQFLMVYSIDMEGSNYEGISLLRSCYGSWLRKNMNLKLNAIGTERFAIKTPIVTVPAGKENQESFGFLITALESYMSGQSNYLTVPEGYTVVFPAGAEYDPAKVDSTVDAEDRRMAKAFLANFLELGMNNGGSFGMSEDLSDFFLSGIEHLAGGVCQMVNANLIPELVNLNFFEGVKNMPKLTHSGITDKAGKELAEVLHFLTGAQIIEPDDLLEANVRKRYHLPKKSELGKRVAQPTVAGTGGFGIPGQPPTTLSERIRRRITG